MATLATAPSIAAALAERFTSMQDRAERAENEVSRQREALSLCPIPVMVLNQEATCVYANPACMKILKCDYHDLLGDNWRIFIHPEDRCEVTHLIDVTIQSELESYQGDHRIIDKTSSTIHVYAKVSRTRSGDYIAYVIPAQPGCSAVCLKNGGHDRTRTG